MAFLLLWGVYFALLNPRNNENLLKKNETAELTRPMKNRACLLIFSEDCQRAFF
jgi:hypothetical protein